MSILLDALRKSERQERLGHVPSIHQPGDGADAPESTPRGRLWWLALPLFAVLAWLSWQQLSPPAEPVTDESVPQAAERTPDAIVTRETTASAEPATERVDPPPRVQSPLELLPDGPAVTRADSTASTQATTAATQDGPNASLDAAPGPGVSVQPLEPGRESAPNTAQDSTQAAADTPWRPARPGPMSYWQLPENTRNALGELKLSVLVYDEDPERRFVLLNGDRAREGDQPQPGLEIEEIQRDGVVFQYQLYRFVLKR